MRLKITPQTFLILHESPNYTTLNNNNISFRQRNVGLGFVIVIYQIIWLVRFWYDCIIIHKFVSEIYCKANKIVWLDYNIHRTSMSYWNELKIFTMLELAKWSNVWQSQVTCLTIYSTNSKFNFYSPDIVSHKVWLIWPDMVISDMLILTATMLSFISIVAREMS